jgi:2-polyprenyl-3-methyl-5-hydroxy-6-metoxy-1,4-benzoquinol methylase
MSEITQEAGWYFDAYFTDRGLVHAFHKRRIDGICSLVPDNKTILDCGCGSGIIAHLLSRNAKSVAGVDVRKECIDFCNKKIEGNFKQADLKDFDLDEKFDVIICSDVIEHFHPEEREKVLRNLDRHLNTRGTLIFTFPSRLYITLEPFWFKIRSVLNPQGTFDDEAIHLLVTSNHLTMENYTVIKRGVMCVGLILYLVLEKLDDK